MSDPAVRGFERVHFHESQVFISHSYQHLVQIMDGRALTEHKQVIAMAHDTMMPLMKPIMNKVFENTLK